MTKKPRINHPENSKSSNPPGRLSWFAAILVLVLLVLLIFVEGVESNPVCSGGSAHWWGGNLEPQACYPLDIPADKLVLSPHVYGPDVYPQEYFNDPDFPENMGAIWEAHFGFLVNESYAVVPGEFGGKYGHGGNPRDPILQDSLVDYFLEKDIPGFFYWCWNPNSGDTGGILKDDWTTVWDDKVVLLHRMMADGDPTPTPVCGPGFPDRVFAPYVDVCIYPRFFITEMNTAMGTKYYTLAFVVSANDGIGRPAWGGYPEYLVEGDWYRDEIDEIQARGGDVIVSFGGEASSELALAHDNVEDLRAAYQSVIDRYHLTRVDFDIEGAAVAHTESIDRRNKAIKLLQDQNPDLTVAYCLPVIPSGLTQDGINLLQNAIDNGVRVDAVNIMAMFFGAGAAPNPDGQMAEYAIEAAESLFDQLKSLYPEKSDSRLWRMVGITPMIGRGGITTEVFYLEDAEQLLAFAREKNINLISMWSANRDNGSCGAASYSSPLCSSLEQDDFAFSEIFEQFTGAVVPTPTPAATGTPEPTATAPPAPSPSVPAVPTPTPGDPGPTVPPTPAPPIPPAARQLPVIESGDYDGDGSSDVALFRPSTGFWAVRGITACYFGKEGDIPTPGDWNGDGTTEIALFRPSTGLWSVRDGDRLYFGKEDDIPVPADYDGTGASEIAVFRPASGLWAVRGVTRDYFGQPDDRPLPGDYNGDGTAEIALFRPSTGLWAVRDGGRLYFGGEGDIPVPADYDGNWELDAAIFRPASGLWAVRGGDRLYFGGEDDIPVPADYNGDGTAEFGLFRESSGLWAVSGVSRLYFGIDGDIPVTR
ncbi:MAG: cellulase family glycosylhydrolase [Candidatus Euphemobacter frigidus]|nr:cellulase family glycosylhydrolase [Candidatus Euphemobacter frigidus]MDP8276692.1 cellulase family glycosylhydrolase [Candidatus Euphemobacter frigidus]